MDRNGQGLTRVQTAGDPAVLGRKEAQPKLQRAVESLVTQKKTNALILTFFKR